MPEEATDLRTALPSTFADGDLFHRWGASSLKLYLWLRARARRAAPVLAEGAGGEHGYLEVHTTGSEIEDAIGFSKNSVIKLARELRELRVVILSADRRGYHFRLGEWFSRRATGADLELVGEAFYLEALVAARPGQASKR